MPTTPIYQLPYPAAADPADVPLDMQELAERIEAGGVPGGELAYAQITANKSITGTTEAAPTDIVTLASFTFTGQPVWVEFFAPYVKPAAAANSFVLLAVYQDGSSLGFLGTVINPGAGVNLLYVPVYAKRKLTPSAGAHTLKVGAYVNVAPGEVGAGPGGAAAYSPCYLRMSRA